MHSPEYTIITNITVVGYCYTIYEYNCRIHRGIYGYLCPFTTLTNFTSDYETWPCLNYRALTVSTKYSFLEIRFLILIFIATFLFTFYLSWRTSQNLFLNVVTFTISYSLTAIYEAHCANQARMKASVNIGWGLFYHFRKLFVKMGLIEMSLSLYLNNSWW